MAILGSELVPFDISGEVVTLSEGGGQTGALYASYTVNTVVDGEVVPVTYWLINCNDGKNFAGASEATIEAVLPA